jgi:hypothetical protein
VFSCCIFAGCSYKVLELDGVWKLHHGGAKGLLHGQWIQKAVG